MSEQPQGKTMKELRAILKEDADRWDALAESWVDLLPHEQQELVETAKAMAAREQ